MRAAEATVTLQGVRAEGGRRTAEAAAVAGALVIGGLMGAAWYLAYANGNTTSQIANNPGPDLFVPLGVGSVGAVLVARRPRNLIGWLFLGSGLIVAVRCLAEEYTVRGVLTRGGLPGIEWSSWLSNWLIGLIFPAGTFLFALLLFPDGHLLGRRWRPVAWAAVAVTAVSIFLYMVDPNEAPLVPGRPEPANPLAIKGAPISVENANWLWPLGLLLLVLAAVSLFIRYRRAGGEERQQLKWFAFAGVSTIVAVAASFVLTLVLPTSVADLEFNLVIIGGIGIAIPVALGVAILKYRLYGIDLVISRTLVYGTLAVLITGVYIGIAVGIGELVGSGGKPNLGLSILATAIVSVGFQPARSALQRVANRLVYGNRVSPYQVLSQFSSQVAGSAAADEVLPRVARLLLEGTAAESATVWLRAGESLRSAAEWPVVPSNGTPVLALHGDALPVLSGATRAVEVRHQGELLGALSVTKRRNDSLTPVEEKLLDDLAHQAGLLLKNVGLTADLQRRLEELRASRQRLVSAQDAERRRLERNLHDGAQQHLVALKVKLGLAQMLTAKDPEKASATLEQLKADTDEALQTLRDLARGIYPPLLAEKGLQTALQAQAQRATVDVSVDADGIGRYSQEVEATVYFCVLEALQNVQKYAHATHVAVRLRQSDGALTFAVQDDGRGFDVARATRGAGLTNMADRIDSLEGSLDVTSAAGRGTTVSATIPVVSEAA